MEIRAIKTEIFHESEDLLQFIFKYIKKIPESSVLVVTSKILALSEGRTASYKSEKEKVELIKKESQMAIKTSIAWLTIKDGIVMANSGIDESNSEGKLILSPQNSFASAEILRKSIMKKFNLKKFGVLIVDSGLLPLRAGAVGVALGYAGFEGVRSYVGKKDLFGRVLKMSKTNVADALATSAVLLMGEGKEAQPLALITHAPVIFINKKVNRKELIMDRKKDLYAPLFGRALKDVVRHDFAKSHEK